MLFETNNDLPDNVKNHLPLYGQNIYREAYNSAWEGYHDPLTQDIASRHENSAHLVAWNAVRREYEQNNVNQWIKK